MNLHQIAVVLATISGLPQSPLHAERPAFEVASIKPSGPHSVRGSDGGPGSKDPSRYIYNLATLRDLIEVAWNVRTFQLSSTAALDKERFDLAAKLPDATTKAQFRLMLQNLLTERFALKYHIESRELSAYELTTAKSGLKLKQDVPGDEVTSGVTHQMSISGDFELVRVKVDRKPLSAVFRYLRTPDDLPLVDHTGLQGIYTFVLEYARELPAGQVPGSPPPAPSLFTAVQQQLGLQIVARKLPFDIVVVESFRRLPIEN